MRPRLRSTSPRWLLALLLAPGLACRAEEDFPAAQSFELDGFHLYTDFDEAVCAGTLPYLQAQRDRIVAIVGRDDPFKMYWARDGYPGCPFGRDDCTTRSDDGIAIYSDLQAASHEMAHALLARLGTPAPWLIEGTATMLEDGEPYYIPPKGTEDPGAPDVLFSAATSDDVFYADAARFTRYIAQKLGLAGFLELYAASNEGGEDPWAAGRRASVVAEHLGVDVETLEADYAAARPTFERHPNFACAYSPIAWSSGPAPALHFEATGACDEPWTVGPIFTDAGGTAYIIGARFDVPETANYDLTLSDEVRLTACTQDPLEPQPGFNGTLSRGAHTMQLTAGAWQFTSRVGGPVDPALTVDIELAGP
ncbi:hypothetical protein [Nannocystis punicea]|uniref:Uncharacterized protein n=1 Tax=Nannocystis punicea TaxID=2995304 RepID=A0ABY7H876_9BACT|nr:hypothetical protein [Nannocystis poenicansa]WAS95466.1 hypothetical protein O0S08_04835 [Nannocystis poenicansa]